VELGLRGVDGVASWQLNVGVRMKPAAGGGTNGLNVHCPQAASFQLNRPPRSIQVATPGRWLEPLRPSA
jgi:hypothetical protein